MPILLTAMIISGVSAGLLLWWQSQTFHHEIVVTGLGWVMVPTYQGYTDQTPAEVLQLAVMHDQFNNYAEVQRENSILFSIEDVIYHGDLQIMVQVNTTSIAYVVTAKFQYVQVDDRGGIYCFGTETTSLPVNLNTGDVKLTIPLADLDKMKYHQVPGTAERDYNAMLISFTFTQIKDIPGVHTFDLGFSIYSSDS